MNSRVSVKTQIIFMVVCMVLGIMLVTQFRTQGRVERALKAESTQDQATIISNLYDSNLNLQKEVDRLLAQLEDHQQSMSDSELSVMADDLNHMRILSGSSDVVGPGVQLSLSAGLRAEDVLDLVNEFRNAGAEAIAVNDQRIVASSSFSNDPEGVLVNGVVVKPPFVFSAIGHPDTLEKALNRAGGLLTIISNSHPSAITTLEKRDKLTLPLYKPGYTWEYAQVANP